MCDELMVDATTKRINSLLFKVKPELADAFYRVSASREVLKKRIIFSCDQVRSLRMSGSCALNLSAGLHAHGRLDLFYELGFGDPWYDSISRSNGISHFRYATF
ncbi:hypothetical protein RHMOL_Rhmol02G0110800 [Rhododendron molle]|uniref:Uncharacterized protein n=1 Tax=Rhododendron molle TaxID=49168 RepID=A0ACC0PQA2_RHOML|nr:hypothetical protein RHMOL_Rhmol02G0110800 [Rhododendron molle]